MKTQNEYLSRLDPLQVEIANRIYNKLPDDVNKTIECDSCVIDIIVNIGNVEKHTTLAQGRFRVFWSSTRDYKIGYLPAGLRFWDGYEVLGNKWIMDISPNDVVALLNTDILENWGI